jgi:2-polyprenyl-6-methoxyphenol hydroxylase-like FAD-dependent oxidoreductase
MNYEKVPSIYNYLQMCEQWYTEKTLTEYLLQNGIKIERGVEYESFVEEKEFLDVKTNEGKIKAKYVIGADGAKSKLRKDLNIKLRGEETDLYLAVVVYELNEEIKFYQDKQDVIYANLNNELGSSFLIPLKSNLNFYKFRWIVSFSNTIKQRRHN